MSQSNSMIPPGASEASLKRRKTKVILTVCVIVAIHVIPISSLILVQGCSSSDKVLTEQGADGDPTMANAENVYLAPGEGVDNPAEEPAEGFVMARPEDVEEPNPAEPEAGETNVTEVANNASNPPAPAAPEAPAEAQPSNSEPESSEIRVVHTIRPSDRIYTLARQYNSTVEAIVAANPGLDPHKIRLGQQIVIPGKSNAGANPAPVIVDDSNPPAPASSSGQEYVIQRGDTLIGIARRNGITLRALREANQLRSDRIIVGRKLTIPVKDLTSAQ